MNFQGQTLVIAPLKKRSDMHWARKIWHMGGVFFLFVLYQFLPPFWSVLLMSLGTLAFVGFDWARQRWPSLNEWALHAFRLLMREHEVSRWAGTTYLFLGVRIVLVLFPRDIVSLTLLFLGFADPLASFIGIRYGREKIWGNKSVQGFFAAFVVCTVMSYLFTSWKGFPHDRSIVFSLLAGLVGALAELIPIGKIDDNFTLPCLSACGLFLLFYFFGFLPVH